MVYHLHSQLQDCHCACGTIKSCFIGAVACPTLIFTSLEQTIADDAIMPLADERHNSSSFLFTPSIASFDALCKQSLPSSSRRRSFKRARTFHSSTSPVKLHATFPRRMESTGSRNPSWKVSHFLSGGCTCRSVVNPRRRGPSHSRRTIRRTSS